MVAYLPDLGLQALQILEGLRLPPGVAEQGGGQTTGGYSSPKTFDAGTALYAVSAVLSGAGAAVLRRRKR